MQSSREYTSAAPRIVGGFIGLSAILFMMKLRPRLRMLAPLLPSKQPPKPQRGNLTSDPGTPKPDLTNFAAEMSSQGVRSLMMIPPNPDGFDDLQLKVIDSSWDDHVGYVISDIPSNLVFKEILSSYGSCPMPSPSRPRSILIRLAPKIE